MGKKIKVAMILYTQGLEYDDRIRKEILSIQKNIPEVKFTIFAIVPKNEEKQGETDYGVPYYIPYLKTREKFKSGTKTLQKAYDFYKNISPKLADYDVIWCADIETFLFPLLLSRSTKIVWDQHELPAPFMRNWFTKLLFKYMENKCRIMYHANKSRIDYLKDTYTIKQYSKHIEIRNYPENFDSQIPDPDIIFEKYNEWLNNRKCVYIQGISGKDRKCFETLSAILKHPELCAVVIGGVDKKQIDRVSNLYSEEFISDRLFFTGKVPQKMTKLYMSKCCISLVFYAMNTPNNMYCEPNRMFQSIMMGLPVVVGKNPPMKEVIDSYCVGISLDNDGSDVDTIISAMDKILNNYDYYKNEVLKNRVKLKWDYQEKILVESFKRVINNN